MPAGGKCKKIRDDEGREPGTGEWMSKEKYIWKKAKLNIFQPTVLDVLRNLKKDWRNMNKGLF